MRYYTVKEVAEMFRVTERTVYRWLERGMISYLKFGKVVRIPEDEIERIFRQYMKRRK